MPTGASEGYGQIALAFRDVVRQQINQQVGDALDELDSLRKRADVAGYGGMAPGVALELWNIVGIRKKADIEDQVAIRRHTVPVAETGHVDHDLGLLAFAAEALRNKFAQL